MTAAVSAALVTVAVGLLTWHPRATSTRTPARPLPRVPAPGPVAGAAVVAGAAIVLGAPLLLVPTLALVAWAVSRLAARARQEQQATRRRGRVVEACEALLGELRAGRPPEGSLASAAGSWPELAPVAATAGLGGDVPSALREVARHPGAQAVERIAGAWQLCAATGSGLAGAVEQVLLTVRADHEVMAAVRAELASARATARLLAVLPLLVLVMAQGIGADPWRFLLTSTPGLLCLGAGVSLAVAGVSWLDRIADEAQGGAA